VIGQTWQAWELVIVIQGDDAVLHAAADDAVRLDPRILVVSLPERGVSRARNVGAHAARYETIAFLDDDCEARSDWLATIAEVMGDETIGIVGGALLAPPSPRWRVARCPVAVPADLTFRPQSWPVELPAGAAFVTANCAVQRWAWERIGPFDEMLGAGAPLRGGEDLDYLLRAARLCVPVRFRPDLVVRHSFGTRFGLRAVARMGSSYAHGQGAVAAKLALGDGSAGGWRRAMRDQCLWQPLRSLRPDRLFRRLPRLLTFERGYRACLAGYELASPFLLRPR
jgi:glycosyltransferase involved in cell wall biosynthesis